MKSDNLLEYQEKISGAEIENEVALFYKPSCGEVVRCNRNCCKSFSFLIGICAACAVGAALLASSGPDMVVVSWLVGAAVPFVALSVYASEIFGGSSVDKGQVLLAFILHSLLFVVLLTYILPYVRNPAMISMYPLDEHSISCQVSWYKQLKDIGEVPNPFNANGTVVVPTDDTHSLCYGKGLALGLGGAVPEEILKFVTIGAFIRRGWIADPFAIVVYCFVIGSTFGFLENSGYISVVLKNPGPIQIKAFGVFYRTFIAQTIAHATMAILTGLLMAQRKFLFWRKHGETRCCEFFGPRPFYVVLFPAIWFHFVNNFAAGALPSSWHILTILIALINATIMMFYARYLFLTLKNVPRVNIIELQASAQLPTALTYICCGCCKGAERDRRYVSVLDMVDMKTEEHYSPPALVEV